MQHKIDPAKPLIAVLPGGGASWGKAARNKRWSAPNYAHLIDKIIENFDAAIILMGDSKEEELCREVVSLAHFPLYFAVGETSLLGLAALLKQMPRRLSSTTEARCMWPRLWGSRQFLFLAR